MFDSELFTYDSENHIGYYKGVVVPSVTQLVDLLYPMDQDIPSDRIENASKRGTEIHAMIERINSVFQSGPRNWETSLRIAGKLAFEINRKEIFDYVALLNAYKLVPIRSEMLVFLCDQQGELICYGHLDCVMGTMKDNEIMRQGEGYVCDYKTTSVFDRNKTGLQTQIYRVAFNQMNKINCLRQTFGIHLRENAKIIPLKIIEDYQIIELCKGLKEIYDRKRINS